MITTYFLSRSASLSSEASSRSLKSTLSLACSERTMSRTAGGEGREGEGREGEGRGGKGRGGEERGGEGRGGEGRIVKIGHVHVCIQKLISISISVKTSVHGFRSKTENFKLWQKKISSERASQEEQNGPNFSLIAPSSEEL